MELDKNFTQNFYYNNTGYAVLDHNLMNETFDVSTDEK